MVLASNVHMDVICARVASAIGNFHIDPVFISIVSAIIASLNFLFNRSTYRARLKLEQASNAVKLHEKWWSEDYYSARRKIYSLIQDWNKGEESGKESIAFLDYFFSSEGTKDRPTKAEDFVRIAFFFADLNVYIDEDLISPQLAYRLLGDSQYSWFRDFIEEVRKGVETRHPHDSANSGKIVRWVAETKALEEKFDSFRG